MTYPIHARRRWDRMCVIKRLFLFLFVRRRGSDSTRRSHHVVTGDLAGSVGPDLDLVPTVRAVSVLAVRSAARTEPRPPTTYGGFTVKNSTHHPCAMCGMAESPSWRGPTNRQGIGLICGRCGEWLHEGTTSEARDLAASVLAGIATTSRRTVPSRLGQMVGLVYWSESGRTEANATPWAHLDVAALRRRVAELADDRHVSLPRRWSPSLTVSW
jgi:hypothetical protein